jgi:hypothetical protein
VGSLKDLRRLDKSFPVWLLGDCHIVRQRC